MQSYRHVVTFIYKYSQIANFKAILHILNYKCIIITYLFLCCQELILIANVQIRKFYIFYVHFFNFSKLFGDNTENFDNYQTPCVWGGGSHTCNFVISYEELLIPTSFY